MLLLKIVAIAIACAAGLLQIGLEYKWHDKRTKLHRVTRRFLIAVVLVGTIMAIALVILDDRQARTQIANLTHLQLTAEASAADAVGREKQAIQDRASLREEISELADTLEPFLAMATARYPDPPAD